MRCYIINRTVPSVSKTSFPNLKVEDLTLSRIKTKGDEIKDVKFKTEKLAYANVLKSLKIEEFYKKNFNGLNEKKDLLLFSGNFDGICFNKKL